MKVAKTISLMSMERRIIMNQALRKTEKQRVKMNRHKKDKDLSELGFDNKISTKIGIYF